MKVSPGAMPAKLNPGTPSIWVGVRMPCQWIELGSDKPVGDGKRHRIALAPAQDRRRHLAVDADRRPRPAGDVHRHGPDLEREVAAAEKRRACAVAQPSATERQGQSSKRTGGDNALDEAAAAYSRAAWEHGAAAGSLSPPRPAAPTGPHTSRPCPSRARN